MSEHRTFTVINTSRNELARALGRRLRYLRAQTGLTQLELGRRAAIDRTYISRLERGRILPGYPALVRLADSLGVSVSKLIDPTPSSSRVLNVIDMTRQ